MKVYAEWKYNPKVAVLDVLDQMHISCGLESDEYEDEQWDGFMADSKDATIFVDFDKGTIRMEHTLSYDYIRDILFAMIECGQTFWLSPDTSQFGEAISFGIDYE